MESALYPPDEPGFALIETFGYHPGRGVERVELHLDRLARSAAAFGLPVAREAVADRIAAIHGDRPLRCRLALDRNGRLDLTTAPMPAPATAWTFRLAPERLDEDDPFLRHKTTRRALYDTARAALPDGVDELVFLNRRGEICEGTITNIALRLNGAWLTPPITSGCLPGTYRQHLLNQGRLGEAVLTAKDLDRAEGILLMNALRGEIEASFDPAS